jgi:uncharacterized protein YbcV (DUF1398 family)
MDTEGIARAAHASIAGTSPFPEVVATLVAAGVENYHVDYIALGVTYYGAGGAVATTPLSFEGMPGVATQFDAAELRAAILDSQRHGQSFRDFTARAMAAGVQGYFAFLTGKRVTYWGRGGEQHTEWFPGAAQK